MNEFLSLFTKTIYTKFPCIDLTRPEERSYKLYVFHTKKSLMGRKLIDFFSIARLRTREASSRLQTKWRATTNSSSAPCRFTSGTTIKRPLSVHLGDNRPAPPVGSPQGQPSSAPCRFTSGTTVLMFLQLLIQHLSFQVHH